MIEFAITNSKKKVKKFDDNFDIQCQLEHFEYEMNKTLEQILENFR